MKRPLTSEEETNLALIREFATDIAFLYLTPTGMQKSLVDAVLPVRTLLATHGIHNYAEQAQGPANKVEMTAFFLEDADVRPAKTTLYRPVTKKGDPRIWFSRLGEHANANDVLALFIHDGSIHVVNLSRSHLASMRTDGGRSETLQHLDQMLNASMAVSTELLDKLRRLAAGGPLPAVCEGDTAIGRTIETALGLAINSSKKPDYKGIELKSARETSVHTSRENRAQLFAQVANWTLSRLKSSHELLDVFGYDRGGVRKLYCTVAIEKPNSQGLQLELLRDLGRLAEIHVPSSPKDVVVWELDRLHQRLQEKHRETFWIAAESVHRNGKEHFVLKSIRHTRSPSSAQFDELLEEGHITVDHLIKRKDGRVVEKGPLFKITKQQVPALFLTKLRVYTL